MLRRPYHEAHLRPFIPLLGVFDFHPVIFHGYSLVAPSRVQKLLQIKTRPGKAALIFLRLDFNYDTSRRRTEHPARKNIALVPFRECRLSLLPPDAALRRRSCKSRIKLVLEQKHVEERAEPA
jgi:hypothetical protein